MAIAKKVLAIGAIAAFSFAVFAASQADYSGKGNGYSMNGKRALKTDSIDHFKGKILSVKRVAEPDGTKIHLVLQTEDGEDKTFIIGPASYVDQSRISLEMGDKVTISGYEVNVNGEQMWIATKVEKGNAVLNLRQKNGEANWQYNRNGNSRMSNGRNNHSSY